MVMPNSVSWVPHRPESPACGGPSRFPRHMRPGRASTARPPGHARCPDEYGPPESPGDTPASWRRDSPGQSGNSACHNTAVSATWPARFARASLVGRDSNCLQAVFSWPCLSENFHKLFSCGSLPFRSIQKNKLVFTCLAVFSNSLRTYFVMSNYGT